MEQNSFRRSLVVVLSNGHLLDMIGVKICRGSAQKGLVKLHTPLRALGSLSSLPGGLGSALLDGDLGQFWTRPVLDPTFTGQCICGRIRVHDGG